jgi:2'-5' RNA ligase
MIDSAKIYDVVLLPVNDIAYRAVETSKIFKTFDNYFTLEIEKYIPHISLYMLSMKASNLAEAKEMLRSISDSTHILDLKATNYHQSWGYIEVGYQKSEELISIQNMVVEQFNTLRTGIMPNEQTRIQDASGLALLNLQNYGYRYIADLFRPHVTFTRLKNKTPIDLDLMPDSAAFSGKFTRVGLFEVDENQACVKEIHSANLQ